MKFDAALRLLAFSLEEADKARKLLTRELGKPRQQIDLSKPNYRLIWRKDREWTVELEFSDKEGLFLTVDFVHGYNTTLEIGKRTWNDILAELRKIHKSYLRIVDRNNDEEVYMAVEQVIDHLLSAR